MSRRTDRRTATTRRTSASQVLWLEERLGERDWAILGSLDRLRLATADQLERLHFSSLSTTHSREVVRGRVLRRLVAWRVIAPLGRRIGGVQRGSGRLVYALDSAGQRLLRLRQAAEQPHARQRRPVVVGERFLAHVLAVSELYVSLATGLPPMVELAVFDTEPACWWPDGLRGWIKPDAYLRLSTPSFDDHWWVEVDRATESLPTLRRKLAVYLDFYRRGQLGPRGVMPRILVSTITEAQRHAVQEIIDGLPEPAGSLFVATLDRDALLALLASLKE